MDHRVGQQTIDRLLGASVSLRGGHIDELKVVDARGGDVANPRDPEQPERLLHALAFGIEDPRLQFDAHFDAYRPRR